MTTELMDHTNADALVHRTAALALVAATERAYNAHDPIAIAACYSAQAVWTNVSGLRVTGRRAIAAQLAAFFVRVPERQARFDVVEVVPVSPDVLAVGIDQVPLDRAGQVAGGPRGALLYIIARNGDRWEIAACQYTAVAGGR